MFRHSHPHAKVAPLTHACVLIFPPCFFTNWTSWKQTSMIMMLFFLLFILILLVWNIFNVIIQQQKVTNLISNCRTHQNAQFFARAIKRRWTRRFQIKVISLGNLRVYFDSNRKLSPTGNLAQHCIAQCLDIIPFTNKNKCEFSKISGNGMVFFNSFTSRWEFWPLIAVWATCVQRSSSPPKKASLFCANTSS